MANKKLVSVLSEKFGVEAEVLNKVLDSEKDDDQEVIKIAETLTPYNVFSPDEFTKRLDNEKAAAKAEGIKEGTGNSYGAMDKRIQQEFGIDKQENEKTVDYMARVLKEKAAQSGSKPSEELERMKALISEKDTALKNALAEVETVKGEYTAKQKQIVINSKIDSLVNSLPIETTRDIDTEREFLRFQFEKAYEVKADENNNLIVIDRKTGKEVKNPKTADALPVDEVFKDFAPKVVTIKSDVRKRGNGFKDTAIPKDKAAKGDLDYSQYESRDEFKKHLAESGINVLSQEGTRAMEGYMRWERENAAV